MIIIMYTDVNTFFYTLDKRYQEKVSREGGTVAKKVRQVGSPSESCPPVGAPRWTIHEDYTLPNGKVLPACIMIAINLHFYRR